jgi:hypothetical protein
MCKTRTTLFPLTASFLLTFSGCGGDPGDFHSELAEVAKAAEKGKSLVKAESQIKSARRPLPGFGKLADDDTF